MGTPLPQFGFPRLRAMFRDDTLAATTPWTWVLGPLLDKFHRKPRRWGLIFFEEGLASRIVAEDTVVRYSPGSAAARLQARKKP